MVYDVIMVKYPHILPLALLILGTLCYNFMLIRKGKKTIWNFFMIATAVLGMGYLAEFAGFVYGNENAAKASLPIIAFAAVIYLATIYSTKK